MLIPRCELDRVHEAIVKAGEQKLTALQRAGNLQRTVSLEEWRHTLAKKTMEDLQEHLKELSTVKVSPKRGFIILVFVVPPYST